MLMIFDKITADSCQTENSDKDFSTKSAVATLPCEILMIAENQCDM